METGIFMSAEPMSRIDRGRLGAAKRWGGRRIVRLDSLDPTVRAVVVNLVETAERIAREKAETAVSETSAIPAVEASDATLNLAS